MEAAVNTIVDVDCTCGRLRKASRVASRLYDRHLAQVGLNIGQYGILKAISRLESASISELAEERDMERTTLTRNLSPLVRCGYVAVGAGVDRRSKSVTLSKAGKNALAEARPLWQKAQDEIDTALGSATKKKLHDELDRSILRLRTALADA
jgi:DNA-binding MarR family transcriptional regulator